MKMVVFAFSMFSQFIVFTAFAVFMMFMVFAVFQGCFSFGGGGETLNMLIIWFMNEVFHVSAKKFLWCRPKKS